MIVDLAEIEGSSKGFAFTVTADELDLEDAGFRLVGDSSVTGEVIHRAAQIDVKGTITGKAETDCTRCLKPVERDVAIEFEVSFVSPEHFSRDGEHEVSASDLDVDVLEDSRLDLKNVVREQLLLNMEGQVFCGPDCKGLCPKCGADLNLIDCNCDLNDADPRWAALKNLRPSE